MKNKNNEYHGIIFNVSQKDKSVFRTLRIIGKKKFLAGLLIIYKISISQEDLDDTIKTIQNNMRDAVLFINQQFYVHFYRQNELIIVFKDKIYRAAIDRSTWKEAIEYGLSLGIKAKQLDFQPCKFEEETF
jgi:hypothetical protein